MGHCLISPATGFDADELDRLVRLEDRREFEDFSGSPFLQTLKIGVLVSAPAITLRDLEGNLAGILGVNPTGDREGAIWMACTGLIEKRQTAFLRGSREVLATLHRKYDLLHNVVDARNGVHVRWLKWLGFTFLRQIEHGPQKLPAWEFAKLNV